MKYSDLNATERLRTVVQDKRVYRLCVAHMEVPQGVSETVPDDTLTIKQILAKHVRGMEIAETEYRTPVWNGTEDYDAPDLEAVNRMDLAERHEFTEALRADIESRKALVKEALEKAEKEKAKKPSESTAPTTESKKGKKEGGARSGENPPDDVSSRSRHAARTSERSGRSEGDTRGISGDD